MKQKTVLEQLQELEEKHRKAPHQETKDEILAEIEKLEKRSGQKPRKK